MNRKELSREQQLRQEIDLIAAVTADFEAAAKDLLIGSELSPSNVRAREEVIELLGVNYVGPESLGQLLYGDESTFPQVELDYIKLKEILNEPDEFESTKKRFETYALVFMPPISFLELRDKANEVASAQGKSPAFCAENWYVKDLFASAVPNDGSWELVRRETVPGSTARPYLEQLRMIKGQPGLVTTSFPALAAMLVGQYLAQNIQLYDGDWHYGRTDHPVCIGYMNDGGADLFEDTILTAHVGLAVSRRVGPARRTGEYYPARRDSWKD